MDDVALITAAVVIGVVVLIDLILLRGCCSGRCCTVAAVLLADVFLGTLLLLYPHINTHSLSFIVYLGFRHIKYVRLRN